MNTQSVGIREFRDHLAAYLLTADKPLAITRHGETIGYYLPRRRKITAAETKALRKAHARLQAAVEADEAAGDGIVEQVQRLRKEERRKKK